MPYLCSKYVIKSIQRILWAALEQEGGEQEEQEIQQQSQ